MKETIRKAVVTILTWEAKAVLRRYKPRIIVVTGSVGKTSAKDAIYTALAANHFVRKSEKSFNSDIGAPLTILGVPNGWSNPVQWIRNILDGLLLILIKAPYPEWLIVEVGADRPGDISTSLAWLKPEVVVATRFPAVPVHVEFYDSPEAVQAEELSPLSWLRPGGIMVGNADDDIVKNATVPEGVEKILYGVDEDATVRCSKIKFLTWKGMPSGMSFDVHIGKERARVTLDSLVGSAHLYAALAGIGTATGLGIPLAHAAERFVDHKAPPGRMNLVRGIKNTVLIDDTYNASPVAVMDAIHTLLAVPAKGRKIAVLGDMLELGSYSVEEHEKVGREVYGKADLLITVGVRARGYAIGAEKAGMQRENILQFDKTIDAAEHLATTLEEGSVVLIKGSQGMRMERITKLLMAEPEKARKLLPRQDAEWLMR